MDKRYAVQAELEARLQAVEGIGAVLNPVDVRDPANHPAEGAVAVVWAMQPTSVVQGNGILWQQKFGIDIKVDWPEENPVQTLAELSSRIAYALVRKWPHDLLRANKSPELSGPEMRYPEKGGAAVISADLSMEIAEKIPD